MLDGLRPAKAEKMRLSRLDGATNLDNKVYSVPLDASASAATLSSVEAYPWDIVCDGADLYWVNSGSGQVRKMKKTGGAVTTIAQSGDLSGTGWYLGQPKHLAVDATYVYWTDQGTQYGGGVFRVSKNRRERRATAGSRASSCRGRRRRSKLRARRLVGSSRSPGKAC